MKPWPEGEKRDGIRYPIAACLFCQEGASVSYRELRERRRAEFFAPIPIPCQRALAELHDYLIRQCDPRLPCWAFLFAVNVIVQLQPQRADRSGLRSIKGRAVQTSRATLQAFQGRWPARDDHENLRLDFLLRSAHGRWQFLARRGYPHQIEFRDRIARLFRARRFDQITPGKMLRSACLICGRALSDPISRARMIGACCYGSASLKIPWIRNLQKEG